MVHDNEELFLPAWRYEIDLRRFFIPPSAFLARDNTVNNKFGVLPHDCASKNI